MNGNSWFFLPVGATTFLAMLPLLNPGRYPGWFIAAIYSLAFPVNRFFGHQTLKWATVNFAADAVLIASAFALRRRRGPEPPQPPPVEPVLPPLGPGKWWRGGRP